MAYASFVRTLDMDKTEPAALALAMETLLNEMLEPIPAAKLYSVEKEVVPTRAIGNVQDATKLRYQYPELTYVLTVVYEL